MDFKQKKINDIKSKIAKEQELRRRLQTLFKNKPARNTEASKKNQEAFAYQEIKSSPIKKKVNNFPKQKCNKLSPPGENKIKGKGQQKQHKNHNNKDQQGPSQPKINGENKISTKSRKNEKFNSRINSPGPTHKKPTQNNAQHFPNLNKEQKTQKRKGAETNNKLPKKQKLKQNTEPPPDVLHIDSSEFSFSDFSDEKEEADSDDVTYSTDDNFTGSEYSFSNFQDDIDTAAPSGFVGGGNFDDDSDDYDCEASSNMYGEENSFGNDHCWEHDDDDNYSDFDESESEEEEEESFDYSRDMDDDDFYSTATDDEDYHLPDHVPEDLIIHRGTADKRDLYESDEVVFSENFEGAQLIELQHQVCIKRTQQPLEYHRTALEELNKKEIYVSPHFLKQKNVEQTESDTDCPQLVPIVDKDGFKMYSGESDSSESFDSSSYEECSDQDGSIVSIDVNTKYLQDSEEESETITDDDEIDSHQKIKQRMSAEVIEATDVKVDIEMHFNEKQKIPDETNEPDIPPSKKLASKLKGGKFNKGTVIETKVNATKPKVIMHPKECKKPAVELQLNDDAAATILPTNPLENTRSLETYRKPVELTNSGQTDINMPPACKTIPETEPRPSVASCRSIFCNAIDSNHVLVLLREPLYIYGTIKLILIAGSIEIYGYSPKLGEELEIFSTRGLSSVQIVPKPSKQTTLKGVDKELLQLEANFSKVELGKIKENFDLVEDALILLKRNEPRKKLISTFKKYMSENIFPNMNSVQVERPFYASECRLRCIINATDECDKPLRINAQWEQLQLHSNSKVLLIGGKSVGKSTLLRFLVNRHLAQHPRMLLIDLDIGQPELFVPQTISAFLVQRPLLGPGFFLNEQPVQAFAIGHSNIVLCPHRYMRAVKQLINFCRTQTELVQLPWLINTMGYNKGFGAELMAVVCEFLQPTDVVQIQSNKDINNYDYLMEPHIVTSIQRKIYSDEEYQIVRMEDEPSDFNYKLHVFNSAIKQESRYQRDWEMSCKDIRYANILARLSKTLVGHADWLSDCKPLCASLNDLKFLNLLSSGFTQEQILKSIEANLVYLCHHEDDEAPVRCFGIGVVRAIDYHVNQLYLLPALPQQFMNEVNCLAIGEMPLPTSMLTNQGPKVKNTAPFLYNTIDANASKSIKQIFYRPAEFLGGKHKNLI